MNTWSHVSSVPRASRSPSRVPPRYTNPSRTRGLPIVRDDSCLAQWSD